MERLQKLLKILEQRDPALPGLTNRIQRVKQQIADLGGKPLPIPVKKKKKTQLITETITKEVEVDE